ncbi:MAG: bifunctional UDP-N-acetylglucosamine diphosphorylase/glucosamine-1-phosphate N-acetyltransferase GlmU [Deltaproteobacteria bacterium]|nr:bifunctional UDP-N-acetylglucosamine diphosphorylase/glucosamine-1-phosphate N-acetyltransferase GlmU [Deltaproteobacteria bacterium]
MNDLTVAILAAGKGTRMKSATPKLLFEAAGRPLGTWPVATALALRPARVVVVVGHGRDGLQEVLRARFPRAPLVFAGQKEQLGTGHALRCALPFVPRSARRLLVLCGDAPLVTPDPLRRLLAVGRRRPVAMLTSVVGDPAMYGRVLRDERGRVVRIVEHRDATPQLRLVREVNPAVYVFDPAWLRSAIGRLRRGNAQGEFYLTDVVELAAGTSRGVADLRVPFDDLRGVNNRAELAEAEEALLDRIRRTWLVAGVTIRAPHTVRLEADVRLARDVEIGPGAQLLGRTTVAAGASIGAGCILRDVAVGKNAVLLPYVVATESSIGPGARIGPFAHLRPKSSIGREAHVGNFVETKNTVMHPGAKANHLAYVGDGDIGRRTNVGAGTIFCNYDGFGKWRTVLGEDVFVGSDSQLVAPVTVGDGAYVASGSTIVEDVPAGALAVARARQVVKPGYAGKLRAKLAARKARQRK